MPRSNQCTCEWYCLFQFVDVFQFIQKSGIMNEYLSNHFQTFYPTVKGKEIEIYMLKNFMTKGLLKSRRKKLKLAKNLDLSLIMSSLVFFIVNTVSLITNLLS